MTEGAPAGDEPKTRRGLDYWKHRNARLERLVARQRRAKEQAEQRLEAKSLELREANELLGALASELEQRVEERTSELAEERRRAMRLSEEDALTGLANRARFTRLLEQWVDEPETRREGLALILLDLDEFKAINDTFGHPVGDVFLREVGRRMAAAVRAEDLVARLGGDEFAVIARGLKGRSAVRLLAERISRAVNKPVTIGLRNLPARCSLGTAKFPEDAATSAGLLRDADAALYLSKRRGLGTVVGFDAALRADMDARILHEEEVRRAVERNEIRPWLQPIYCCIEKRFVGAEILARWHHPARGILRPARFLATVEDLGLLDAMTENLACGAFTACAGPLAEGKLRYLALNLTPAQVSNGWARERLPALIGAGALPSRGVLIEITEQALLHDTAAARTTVAALSRVGVRLAIDDFGVGYSNFSLLRELSVHVLKLDRSLSVEMEADPTATAIVECILELARRLGIVVIAEGVETLAQATSLRMAGCIAMQGRLLSRPRRDIAAMLSRQAPDIGTHRTREDDTKKDGREKSRP